jgi:hypothetical protein
MNNKMVIQKIDKAFVWLDKISVSGKTVDIMAMVRQELYGAKALCQEEEQIEPEAAAEKG